MPKHQFFHPITVFTFLILILISVPGISNEGISIYYIRYDIKTVNNKIVKDNLLFVPAVDDFRVENFSVISISGAISADAPAQQGSLEDRIRNDALKNILVKNGLKSVKTRDADTVISYEGAMKSPFNIINKTYNKTNNQIIYHAQVGFSPLSFPDNWEKQGVKHKIRKIIQEFFNFFK